MLSRASRNQFPAVLRARAPCSTTTGMFGDQTLFSDQTFSRFDTLFDRAGWCLIAINRI